MDFFPEATHTSYYNRHFSLAFTSREINVSALQLLNVFQFLPLCRQTWN